MSPEFQIVALYGSSVGLSLVSILLGRSSTRRGFLGWKLVSTSLVRFLCVQVALLAAGTRSMSETFLETLPGALWSASAGNLVLLLATRLRINDAYLPWEMFEKLSVRSFLLRSGIPLALAAITSMAVLIALIPE